MIKQLWVTFLVALNAVLISPALAWNAQSHLIMSRIAYDILTEEAPEALQKATELLHQYTDDQVVYREDKYPFVECTTWADDTRRRGGGWQSAWHFISNPLIGDNSTEADVEIKTQEKNISLAMPVLFQWLNGANISDTPMYESIMKRQPDGDEVKGKSLALRLLLHYMGDVHQPLHNVQRYTRERPKGDSGGNAFILKYHYKAKNLHSVWDSVLYEYHQSIKRPFTEESFEEFGKRAEYLRHAFNFTEDEVQTLDFNQYVEESYAIAQIAYDGLTEGSEERVPDDYLLKFTPIARRRVALSGHRLAYMIKLLYGAPEAVMGGERVETHENSAMEAVPGGEDLETGMGGAHLLDHEGNNTAENQFLATGSIYLRAGSIVGALALIVASIAV